MQKSNFNTLIFYRKPLSAEKFISEDKNFGTNFGIKGKKKDSLLKLLDSIDKGKEFSAVSFAKKESITSRTIENYIKVLKDNNLISFEGARKTVRYKVTEKYKKLPLDKGNCKEVLSSEDLARKLTTLIESQLSDNFLRE